MSNALDIDALLERFRERAKAVKRRNLPPVGGDERAACLLYTSDAADES